MVMIVEYVAIHDSVNAQLEQLSDTWAGRNPQPHYVVPINGKMRD